MDHAHAPSRGSEVVSSPALRTYSHRKGERRNFTSELAFQFPSTKPVSLARTLSSNIGACAIAHWYMIPGTDIWREYVRFLIRAAVKTTKNHGALYRKMANEHLGARDFLACDFLWRNLRGRESANSYLDVGSPWVLPFMTLRRIAIRQATLLVRRAALMEHFDHLCKLETQTDVIAARATKLPSIRAERGPFDIVTTISWSRPTDKEIETLASLWSTVKPGGLLLMSLPCARLPGHEKGSQSPPEGIVGRGSERTTHDAYDERDLTKHIFPVVGQPKSHEIYGETTPRNHHNRSWRGRSSDSVLDCRESLMIGRNWKRFARLDELPGQGLIAMKFLRVA